RRSCGPAGGKRVVAGDALRGGFASHARGAASSLDDRRRFGERRAIASAVDSAGRTRSDTVGGGVGRGNKSGIAEKRRSERAEFEFGKEKLTVFDCSAFL